MNDDAQSIQQRELILEQGPIRYRDSGSGEPIVFVHGVFVNGLLWRKVVAELDGEFRCIVPDWPLGAHGLALSRRTNLSPPGIADLIARFIERLDIGPVTVIGNDTGDAFAQLLAVRHPERVSRLVLTNGDVLDAFLPPMFRYLQILSRLPGSSWLLAQALRAPAVRQLPLAYGWLSRERVDAEVLEHYSRRLLDDPGVRRDVRKVLRAINPRHTLAAAEQLRSFDRPVLLAWGNEDRVFPVRLAEAMLELLPHARLEPIAESYAFVPEDQPERLADVISSFMREGRPEQTVS
jgi:pimeloyl-ACP methyl ester carboxylesterase